MHRDQDSENIRKYNQYSAPPPMLSPEELKNKKSILKTNKGTIEIELFGKDAPLTVSNHIFLVGDNFYNNLTFHRREEGFVIQGGDPLGQGFGGPGYKFADEPVKQKYSRGILAMANSGPNTNGSQFFIMLGDVSLPPLYTIFGKVISGIEVIDEIKVGDRIVTAEIAELK